MENDWLGDTPWDLMPHSLNPSDGKIVSANHRIVPTTDDVHLGDIWVAGWRALAIHNGVDEQTSGGGMMGLDECQALQNDFRCIPGERLRDLFAAAEAGVMAEGLSEVEAAAMAALLCWDGRMETDSVGASLYELTSDAMADLIFENLVAHNTSGLDEELDAEAVAAREVLLEMAKGQGINASIRGKSELKCGVISSVLAAMADPAA